MTNGVINSIVACSSTNTFSGRF